MLKSTKELSRSAKNRIRSKLRDRGKASASESLRSTAVSTQNQNALRLPQELADLIGVDIECLRINDRFGDILRLDVRELPENVQPLTRQLGLKASIDPFALDLLHFIEKRIANDESRLGRQPFVPLPSNETEWVERIMGMTVSQFLTALA